MIRDIIIYGDPRLETVCAPVENFNTKELDELVADLKDTCIAANGLGLAAPQIGALQRVAVVRRKEMYLTLINPKIVYQSGFQQSQETCLSIQGWRGITNRSQTVVVEAIDEKGRSFKATGTGLLAAVFSHEIDHLDGRLFIHYLGKKHCEQAKAFIERRKASAVPPPLPLPKVLDTMEPDEVFEHRVIEDLAAE